MTRLLTITALALLVAGCASPGYPTTMSLPDVSEARFTVKRVGTFEDNLAYGGVRGVYVIRDTENETEYVGISGIGISELGQHEEGSGKNRRTVADERQ